MATTKTGTSGSADARPSCANESSASSQASGKAGPSGDARPTAQPSMVAGQPDYGGPSSIAKQSQVSLCPRSAVSGKGETCPQGLMCPLCLDAFKNPTLLACGHTFCKVCLEKYDEQHKGQYFIECPVCRKRTKLAQDRVAAFPSNFSVKVLKEELQTNGNSSSSDNCPLRSKIYKDIFCQDCDKFICLTCFLDKHQGHKIKKKEELDADLKQKRDSLLEKSREKKIQIEKSIASAEQHKLDVHAHFENLKRKVKRTLAQKAKILQENGKQLQKKLYDMQVYHDKLIQTSIADQRRSVDTINKSLKILAGNTGRCTDPDSVKAHHLQFSLLENSLSEITNGVIPAYVKETAKMTQFHPVDENVLDVGHIELGRETPVGKVQEAKNVLDVGHIELGRETPVSKVQEAKTVLDVGHIELGRETPVSKVQEAKNVLDVGHIELGRETPVGKVQEAKTVLDVGHIELGRETPVGKVQEAKTVLEVGHIELGRETPVGKVQEAKTVLDVGHIELGRETPVGKVQEAKTVLDVGHIELGRETPVSKVQEAKTVLDDGHIELGRETPVGKVQEAKTVLDVGHIELGRETPVGKVQEAKNVLEVEKSKNEDLQDANNTADTQAEVRDSSISIVRKIDLPHNMSGMAALSQNAVVIGYGNDGKGCDCFFVSGGKRPHMKSGIGDVMDVAFLTDRCSVVSHDKNTCCLYNPRDPNNTGMRYTFKQGAKFATLCRDQKDNIYAVNGNAEIYVFHVSCPDPLRVVSTGNILPQQICVTKTGIMIISTCVATPCTVTAYSEDGLVGSSIKGSNAGEHLYAAIDSQDRLLVARVFDDSDVFRLTRHTLQGSRLIVQMMFKEIQLPHPINRPGWCYMASLTLNMLAFGHTTQLYFLKLAG